jgi:hypothetical protein
VRRYWPLAVGLAVVVITGLYTGITLGWASLWNSWAIPGMSIATAVAIASGSALLQMAQQGQRRSKELTAERQSPLSNRIEMLRDNLKVSDAIIAEITAELNLQMTSLDRIRAEAEENRNLAALHKDEADAVKKLVETIHTAQNTTTEQGKRQQWMFFVAGLLLGIPPSVLANFVYDLVK